MFNITSFFIKNNVFLILLTLLFLFGGIAGFINLNRNEDPGFKIRTASIITEAKNLTAYQTDNYITKPIENILLQMEEIEDIKEESYPDKSVIYADLYEYYDNIQPIWDRLRRKVELAKNAIPSNLNPVVNDEFADVYGALIGISKKGASYEELYDITESIRDEFLKMKTRGKVEIFGLNKEVLYLYFKNSSFENLRLTTTKLKNFIDSINSIKGGGNITTNYNAVQINSSSYFKDKNDVINSTVNIGQTPILIGDIFDVKKTVLMPIEKQIRANGKDALLIGISLENNGNILNWGKEIKKKVSELKKIYKGVNIEILALQSDYVKTLTDKFTSSLFESILVVIFVVLLILGVKTGIITGGIILVTVLSVFFVMNALNIGLDKISLSALIISLGILVDNSIVVADGCLKENYTDKDKIKAHIIQTASKLQIPLFLVTLSASFSFLPVFIAKSTVSEYASNLFKVVFITLIFSWFYSISLLPYLMIKFGYKDVLNKKEFILAKFIKQKIDIGINNPKKTVLLAIFLFFLSLIVFLFVPKTFFPDSDRNMFEIRLNLKNGTSFEVTKNAVIKTEEYLKTQKDILSFSSYIGTSAPRYVLSAQPEADKVNFGMLLINTKNYKTVNKNIQDAKKFINKNLPNVQAVVRKIPLGPPYDAPVEIRIKNNNQDKLFMCAGIVEKMLKEVKGVYLVKNNWGDFSLEYKIKVNQNASIMAGVEPKYIFEYLNAFYNGLTLSEYYRGDVKIPVILKGDEKLSGDINSINSLSFYSEKTNGIIPLSQVASITPDYTYSKILRRNNGYVITIQGWIDESTTALKVADILTPKLDKVEGLDYEFGGIVEKSRKGNKSVTDKIPVAYGLIFIMLCAYFNDFKKPVLVFLSGIMALTGANFGLFLTDSDFGFITFLGYICLVGICINNGVILVNEIKDYTKEEIKEVAKSRVEPVLLTCLTTIGGMLPLWIKNDPMFSTLGISIIFGLISSITITLFVLPSLCLINSYKTKVTEGEN